MDEKDLMDINKALYGSTGFNFTTMTEEDFGLTRSSNPSPPIQTKEDTKKSFRKKKIRHSMASLADYTLGVPDWHQKPKPSLTLPERTQKPGVPRGLPDWNQKPGVPMGLPDWTPKPGVPMGLPDWNQKPGVPMGLPDWNKPGVPMGLPDWNQKPGVPMGMGFADLLVSSHDMGYASEKSDKVEETDPEGLKNKKLTKKPQKKKPDRPKQSDYDMVINQAAEEKKKLQSKIDKYQKFLSRTIGSTEPVIKNNQYLTDITAACACVAAAHGDIVSLHNMLEQGGDIHEATAIDKRTPLHIAAASGKLECVKFLIETGADVKYKDRSGVTPLMEALNCGHADVAFEIDMALFRLEKKEMDKWKYVDYEKVDGKEPSKFAWKDILDGKTLDIYGVPLSGNSENIGLDIFGGSSFAISNNKSGSNSEHTTPSVPRRTTKNHHPQSEPHSETADHKSTKKKQRKGVVDKIFGRTKPTGAKSDEKENSETSANLQTEPLPKVYGVAFGLLRGECSSLECGCTQYEVNKLEKNSCICVCGHFPASHKNMGVPTAGLSQLNSVENNKKKLLIPMKRNEIWPKILNPHLYEEGNDMIEVSKKLKEDKPEWITEPNKLIFLSKLGQGTSAKVYKGVFDSTTGVGVEVAIKVIDFRIGQSKNKEQQILDLKKEFEIMSKLKSPNVVYLYSVIVNPTICMILEFCSLGAMYNLLQKEKFNVDWPLFFKWTSETLQGLSVLHNSKPQIVHRDVKTLNLLITETYQVKVADFGLSRSLDEPDMNTLQKLRGTYSYTAPEVYFGETYTDKSDIFSVAIVFWELLYKVLKKRYLHPYKEYSNLTFDFQIIIAVAKEGVRPSFPANTPIRLQTLVKKMWQSSQTERPSCHELRERLEHLHKVYLQNKDRWDACRESPLEPHHPDVSVPPEDDFWVPRVMNFMSLHESVSGESDWDSKLSPKSNDGDGEDCESGPVPAHPFKEFLTPPPPPSDHSSSKDSPESESLRSPRSADPPEAEKKRTKSQRKSLLSPHRPLTAQSKGAGGLNTSKGPDSCRETPPSSPVFVRNPSRSLSLSHIPEPTPPQAGQAPPHSHTAAQLKSARKVVLSPTIDRITHEERSKDKNRKKTAVDNKHPRKSK